MWPYLSICCYQVTEVQFFDHTSPICWLSCHRGKIFGPYSLHLVTIRSMMYNIWSYLSIWWLSGHWGTIFDHTSPFGTIRSLRNNIWQYLSIWGLSGHWGTIVWPYLSISILSGRWGIIFDHTSPFGAIRSRRYNIWPYLSIWLLSGHWGTIFDHTSPFGTYQVVEVQYLIIPLHLVLSGH